MLKYLQLVESDLRFEAKEQKAAEAVSDSDIPVMDGDTLSSIPAVHLMSDVIRCRVHIFSQLVQAWPECVSLLSRPMQGERMVPMVCIANIISFHISAVHVNNIFFLQIQ